MSDWIVARLTIAALAGLAVGLEREWSGKSKGQDPRFAGLRTFFLLGILGGVSGWLAASDTVGSAALGVALILAAALLVVTAYFVTARPGGPAVEGTTEVAALAVLALGTLAGLGYLGVTGGATAVMLLALSEKERLHGAVARIGATELRTAAQFAVLALVILPLLPDRTFGPLGGVNPRQLWIVVLIFSGLNFAGYLARKAVGAARGYGVTGVLGGLVSSTAVTLQFSRLSRDDAALGTGLAIGVVGASTVLLPRVMFLSALLNYNVARALLPLLVPTLVVGAIITLVALWRQGTSPGVEPDEKDGSPLRLWSAIRMTLAFQAALMAVEFIRMTLGSPGVIASAAFLGLTDMDALTLSMNRLGTTPELVSLAARAIAVGIIANSVVKLGIILTLGKAGYRRLAAFGLGALMLAAVLTLVLFW